MLSSLLRILDSCGGKPPLTYRHFVRAVTSLRRSPPAPAPALSARMLGASSATPVCEDHDEKWGVPSLAELGFDTDGLRPPVWVGGETEALHRLERHLERKVRHLLLLYDQEGRKGSYLKACISLICNIGMGGIIRPSQDDVTVSLG